MDKFKHISIKGKLGLIMAILMVANLVLFYSLHQNHSLQIQHASTLSVLERQDALVKGLLSRDNENSSNVMEEIIAVQSNLFALQKGGVIKSLGREVTVPATKDKEARKFLSIIQNIWERYQDKASTTKSSGAEESLILLNQIAKNTQNLLARYNTIYHQAQTLANTYLYIAFLGYLLVVFAIYTLLKNYFNKPLQNILTTLQHAAAGDLTRKTAYTHQDEIGKIGRSIDVMIQNQLQLSEFAEKIGEGKFDTDTFQLSEGDKLGLSLVNMREKLQKVSVEDKKRIWATEGMAKFGELLRSANDNIQDLAEQLIIHLVKYLNANQGGIFILYEEDNETFLDLTATYAWNRKKSIKRRILFGEGLVGQVARDKDTVYMTDIPDSYVTIKSGLGKANPKCLLIVPLKVNDEIQGVIEIATFQDFSLFEIEFVEKLSESIAATFSSVRTNEKTKKLLDEARVLNEQMRSQEEEMRQNLEELSSTQEEMQRKEVELTGLFSSINNTLATIEFDLEGNILTANENFCKIMHYSLDELKGKHHRIFVDKEYAASETYVQHWNDLKTGLTKIVDVKRFTKDGREVWLNGSYTPVLDKSGEPYKVIKLAQDITDKKLDEIQAKRLSLVADNTDNSVIITDKNGLIEYVNEGFLRMTGYSLNEVLNKKPGSFLQGPETNQATIQRIRENIQNGKPIYDEILNYDKNGKPYWVSLAINPVFDKNGQLDKYISVQSNITETKIKNLDYNSKLEAISKSNCVVEFTIDGNIITANENFLQLMEYSQEEIQGKHHSIFLKESDKNKPEYKQLWGTLQEGNFVSGEFMRISKSGKEVWIRGIFNVILDINGKPTKIVKFVQDITAEKNLHIEAKKQAEELQQQGEKLRNYTNELEELQRSLSRKLEEAKGEMKQQIKDLEAEKAKNTAILEGCVDGVVAFNHRGTVEFFNKAAEDIWHISRAEVLRRSVTLLMPVEFKENKDETIQVLFLEGETKKNLGIRTEVSFADKTGEEISVLVTLTQAKLGDECTYTLFVQKISVELF